MEYEKTKNCPVFGNGVKCAEQCAWFRETEANERNEPFYLRCALIYVIQNQRTPLHADAQKVGR